MAATFPAGRAPTACERSPWRHECGRAGPASGVESRALPPEHSLLQDSMHGSPGDHGVGSSAVWLRQRPRRRDREDAVRPLLHETWMPDVRYSHRDRDADLVAVRSLFAPGGDAPCAEAGVAGDGYEGGFSVRFFELMQHPLP